MVGRSRRPLGTLVLALVLALTVARPGAAATGSHSGRHRVAGAQKAGPFESVWGWLAGWWTGQEAGGRGLSSFWEAVGPEMDPDGKARPARPVGTTIDMGPEMDPNGK
jgi:hypothetical protein